jgi:hypothetical protein
VSFFSGLAGASLVVAMGLLMVVALYFWRWRTLSEPSWRALVADRFAPLLVTFPLPLLWSLWDFQAYPDLFIFLPYAAIGFGWLAAAGSAAIVESSGLTERARRLIPAGVAVLLVVLAAVQHDFSEKHRRLPRTGFVEQRQALEKVLADHGESSRVLAVGVPQAMALLTRRNPSRFLGPSSRFGSVVDARVDGGFRGWIDSLRDGEPQILFVQPRIHLAFDEKQSRIWWRWLQDFEEVQGVAGWRVLVASDVDPEGTNRIAQPTPAPAEGELQSP